MSEGGETRTIKVDYLARVEGEGSLTLRIENGVATDVRLSIFEPPRFFEALLRGRGYEEAPDITSRICGICPVAYLMSACHAMEDALGLVVPAPIATLRRLLYCGEWIESHALHAFMLHAPDFLGYPDALAMAKDHRGWVQKGLSIKKAGNSLMTALGGREIHPVNVRVGGFYRAPTRDELTALLPALAQAEDDATEALRWMATFTYPDVERDWELVALRSPTEYPILDGRIVSTRGLDIPVRAYDDVFVEQQAPYSNALRSTVRGRGSYLCGPLARFDTSFDRLLPEVRALAASIGLTPPCRNPFRSLLVRMVETIQALAEARRIIEAYRPPGEPAVRPDALRAGTGYGVSEAPRGLLYHRYSLDDEGTITDAQIVAPTSQNQLAIEDDLRAIAGQLATLPHDEATRMAERTVRNHDPCISCATHFLTLTIERP